MGIHIAWDDDEQSIVRWDFEGQWTADDIQTALAESIALRDSVAYRTAIILNLENSPGLPIGILPKMVTAMSAHPQQREAVVVAGGGALAQSIGRIYSTVRRNRNEPFVVVDTLDEARAFIQQFRAN